MKKDDGLFGKLRDWVTERREGAVDWDELEAMLIQSDLGFTVTERIIESLREQTVTAQGLGDALEKEFLVLWPDRVREPSLDAKPAVWMIVGVNGAGKTTTLAKLAHLHQEAGRQVHLVAADTFRAAAIDQLQRWAEKLNCGFTAGEPNGDPAATAFRGMDTAEAEGADLVLIDTAGRLHNKEGLMRELEKVKRVTGKKDPTRPHEVLLLIDGTTGNNALNQAREFRKFLDITGVIVTKLDSTAKGGMIAALKAELHIDTLYTGHGEGLEDLKAFDPQQYARAFRAQT